MSKSKHYINIFLTTLPGIKRNQNTQTQPLTAGLDTISTSTHPIRSVKAYTRKNTTDFSLPPTSTPVNDRLHPCFHILCQKFSCLMRYGDVLSQSATSSQPFSFKSTKKSLRCYKLQIKRLNRVVFMKVYLVYGINVAWSSIYLLLT